MDYIFVIKNYFRTDFVNLTAKSIRHFIPNAKIDCLNLYRINFNEYKNHSFFGIDEIFYRKSKYDSKGLGGNGHFLNALFFSEGYNYIYDRYKNSKWKKILMLTEDHFFTNGSTIKEFLEQDFDIATGIWHHPAIPKGTDPIDPPWINRISVPLWLHRNGDCDACGWGPNASIIGIDLSKDSIKKIFPLPEKISDAMPNGGVEPAFKESIVKKAKELYIFSSRIGSDYKGDGMWSNNLEEIRKNLIKNNILKPEELIPQGHFAPKYSEFEIERSIRREKLWPPSFKQTR